VKKKLAHSESREEKREAGNSLAISKLNKGKKKGKIKDWGEKKT